ncbi:hypothetical protein, partial [Priestia aryabhattai]|uniref:hypothetical protein n=1 Tax=Priestia aryabhattai TaxID=412384 RepID=UPI001C8D3D54
MSDHALQLQQQLLENTFEEVNGKFTRIPKTIKKYDNESDYEFILEMQLGKNAPQIRMKDFMDIAFPQASGFICFFIKEGNKHFFYSKRELEKKLREVLHRNFGSNTYVSYSTYFKRALEFELKEEPIKFGEDVYCKACDIATKEEFFVTKEVQKAKKRRTQSNISKTYLLVQDLDFYKFGISHEDAISMLAALIEDGKIICPTFFIFTGRGIQLVWSVEPFTNIKGYRHDLEWRSIQNQMIDIFKDAGLHPDTVVKNPAAITRAGESLNKTADKLVKIHYTNAAKLTLDHFIFHHNLTPQPDKKVKPKKTQKLATIIHFPVPKLQELVKEVTKWKPEHHVNDEILEYMNWNLTTLNEYRVDDFFTYVKICKERKIPMVAKRNWLAMLVSFHTLVATNGNSSKALEKVIQLWDIIPDKSETSLEEIVRRGHNYAVEKYNDWVNDTWDRTEYVQGGLFYNTRRLLELMGIKEAYDIQYKLKTIKIRNKEYEAYKW